MLIYSEVHFKNLEKDLIKVSGVQFRLNESNCEPIRNCEDPARRGEQYCVQGDFFILNSGIVAEEMVPGEAVIGFEGKQAAGTDCFQVHVRVPVKNSEEKLLVIAMGSYLFDHKETGTTVLVESIPIPNGIIHENQDRQYINLKASYRNVVCIRDTFSDWYREKFI